MSDYLSSVLDELVPTFADEDGDWERVVADAGGENPTTRAQPCPWTRPAHRPRAVRGHGRWRERWLTRRRLVAIALIALLAALLVTPALGIGDRLLSLIQGKRSPARRAGSCLVARRTDDRVRELARRQRRGLRHGRRRQRASEPHAAPGEGCPTCLVARRTEDRLRKPAGRQLRGLRHERRREREAEPHAGSGERRRLSNLVTRRAEDRVPARPSPSQCAPDTSSYVMNADGSGLRRLTHATAPGTGRIGVSWSGHRTGGRSTSGATSSAPTGAERGGSRT